MTPTPDELAAVLLRLADKVTALEQEIVILAGQVITIQRHLAGTPDDSAPPLQADAERWEELKRKAY